MFNALAAPSSHVEGHGGVLLANRYFIAGRHALLITNSIRLSHRTFGRGTPIAPWILHFHPLKYLFLQSITVWPSSFVAQPHTSITSPRITCTLHW